MIYALLFFLIVIALIYSVNFLKENETVEVLFLFCILLFVWGGNRFNGADWINYLREYNRLSEFGSVQSVILDSQFEWLFSFFMWLFSSVGLSYENFVAFVAIVNIVLMLWLLISLKVKNKEMVLVVLFIMEGWTLYHEQLRQSLAVTLSLVAVFLYLKGRKIIPFVVVFIASGFHSSAIFALALLYLTHRVKENDGKPIEIRRIFFSSLILAVGIVLVLVAAYFGVFDYFGLGRLQEKFDLYQTDEVYGDSLFNWGLVAYVIGFVVLLKARYFVISQKNVWASVAWSCAILWCLLGPWLRSVSILIRFEHYLLIFFPFVIGTYGKKVTISRRNLTTFAGVILFGATFLVRIVISPPHQIWLEDYQNIFINLAVGSGFVSADDRQIEICEHLKEAGNPFCE